MRDALRYLLGWFCVHIVVHMPIRLDSEVYCWALGWAGYYAHDERHTTGVREDGNG
jgi:hypothetical protein